MFLPVTLSPSLPACLLAYLLDTQTSSLPTSQPACLYRSVSQKVSQPIRLSVKPFVSLPERLPVPPPPLLLLEYSPLLLSQDGNFCNPQALTDAVSGPLPDPFHSSGGKTIHFLRAQMNKLND